MNYTSGPLRLEHAFDIRINFKDRWVWGPIYPGGPSQGYTSVLNGLVEGPRLSGKLIDLSGADWAEFRPDGVVKFNAHYLIEADDGTRIYIHNMGYGTGPDAPGSPPGRASYFRLTPYFRAPNGPHEWLNRTVIVGGGERHPDPEGDYSLFRYWAVY